MRYILIWALTVEVLGLVCLPLLRAFFENRRDAALLSRPVGLLLVAYVGWALSLSRSIGFERGTLLLALVIVGTASYLVRRAARRSGGPAEPFWGAEEKRAALYFWIPAAIFILIRAAQPEVLGAEKFMDLAFFNSLTRFGAMPPADPWMSGLTINYYYWGYLLAAVLAKLAEVPTFVSYNLAIATFAGYTFAAAACLALRLSGGRTAAAVWGGIGAVFAGNLSGALDAWYAPFAREFDYWHASRVIASGNTINEFPFFTFFHADLHPHLLAFPYFLAVFVIAHRLCEPEAAAGKSRWERALPYLFAAFSAGTAVAANAWNLPAIAIALVFACTARAVGSGPLWRPAALARGAMAGAATLIGGLLLFRPYARTYSLPYNGLGWTTQKSGIFELMGVWGLFFAVAAAALWPPRASEEAARRRTDLLLSASAGAGLLAAFFFRKPALLPLLFLAILGLTAAIRGTRAGQAAADRTVFTLFLLLLSLGMIAGCEFVYFKDSYGDKLQRMNTIFKFYHQAWPLLAVAVVVLAGAAWRAAGARGAVLRALGVTAAALALFYPINATASRLRQREGAFSLDAMPALARRNAGDAAAIAWLEANAAARSVVLEATGDPYREFARISSHTGLPTVMGWANHEGLWRSNDPEVAVRAQLVRGFYSTADEETALEIVKKFDIRYVILGDLERATHPNADHISGFLFLEPVSKGSTTVYKVRGAS